MQIGILTYHRSHNGGAILQAIALRKVISRMGYDVKYVDYWPEYHRRMYKMIDWTRFCKGSIKDRLSQILLTIITLPIRYARARKFNNFINRNIDIFCVPSSQLWDTIVYGSDQIWRKQIGLGNHFNPEYFGAGKIKSKNYLSYAASMGEISINDNELSQIIKWLDKFSGISVREESLKELLLRGGLYNVSTVLDPTLLLTKEEWSSLIGQEWRDKPKSKYLLVYELIKDSFDISTIKNFAKKRNLEIIILKGGPSWKSYRHNIISVIDPFDMIRLIKGAEMVFTSSYHGLIFSLIFEQQFVASFRVHSERAYSILKQVGLCDRLIPAKSKVLPNEIINYKPVIGKLKLINEDSIKWLQKALYNTQT